MNQGDELYDLKITVFQIPSPAGCVSTATIWPAPKGGWNFAVFEGDRVIRQGWNEVWAKAEECCWQTVCEKVSKNDPTPDPGQVIAAMKNF